VTVSTDQNDLAVGGSEASSASLQRRYRLRVEPFAVPMVWIVFIAVFTILKPEVFFTASNARIILGSQAILVILSLALLTTLVVGEFDLSFAAVMGFCSQLVAFLNAKAGWPLIVAILCTLLIAVIIGCLQAFLIVKVGVQSVIITLGMLTLLPGVGQAITQNEVIGGIDPVLSGFTNTKFFGLPLIFYYAIIACLLAWYVLEQTPLGRHLYFIGEGRDVARLAGVEVGRLRAGAILTNAVVSGVAGILMVGQFASASPDVGISYLLPAFAAVFLGSTTVHPGRFNVWGVLVAVYFLVTGYSGLQILGFASWVQPIFFGLSLIVAVVFAQLSHGQRKKKVRR
jgi:ribose transport system permease protein